MKRNLDGYKSRAHAELLRIYVERQEEDLELADRNNLLLVARYLEHLPEGVEKTDTCALWCPLTVTLCASIIIFGAFWLMKVGFH